MDFGIPYVRCDLDLGDTCMTLDQSHDKAFCEILSRSNIPYQKYLYQSIGAIYVPYMSPIISIGEL